MNNKLQFAAALGGLWIALATLAYIVFLELGFTVIRRRWFAVSLLLICLMLVPAGGFYVMMLPYKARIMARFSRVESAPISNYPGCPIFPPNNVWNSRVDSLPVDPNSNAYVQSIGAELSLHADFGRGGGYEYSIAGINQQVSDVSFENGGGESDRGPYRLPDDTPVETGIDHHALVFDPYRCMLYELFNATHQAPGKWTAGSGAIFDLRSNALRPIGWTSADAAGLPILAGLARFDEVATGEVRHALRFTVTRTRRAFVWPGRHYASNLIDPKLPPMGQRFRLKKSFDLSGFSQQTKVLLQALKDYGMILADNGGNWFITGSSDRRWFRAVAKEFSAIPGSQLEAVEGSGLMVHPDSAEAMR